MVASTDTSSIEKHLQSWVRDALPDTAEWTDLGTMARIRGILTRSSLTEAERTLLERSSEDSPERDNVDLLLEARVNEALRICADAAANALGLDRLRGLPRVVVHRGGSATRGLTEVTRTVGERAAVPPDEESLFFGPTVVLTDGDGVREIREAGPPEGTCIFPEEAEPLGRQAGERNVTVIVSIEGLRTMEDPLTEAIEGFAGPSPAPADDLVGRILGDFDELSFGRVALYENVFHLRNLCLNGFLE